MWTASTGRKTDKSMAFTANPPESKVSKDRKEKYSDYDVYEKDYQQSQLWLVDVASASKELLPTKAKRLTTDSSLNISSFAWSPDSTRIAFSATKNPLLAFSGEEDIYLLDLNSNNSVKKIVALPGPDGSPMFSPDGKQLAFGTSLGQQYFYYTNGHVAVVDLAAVLAKAATTAADVRDLTAKFDEDVQPVDWGPDGIYFAAEQKTNAHIYRVNPGIAGDPADHVARHAADRGWIVHKRFQDGGVYHGRPDAHDGIVCFGDTAIRATETDGCYGAGKRLETGHGGSGVVEKPGRSDD